MSQITEFDIDGIISVWGYSNRYVKSYLKNAGKNPVICRVCSVGGDFLMSMNIKDEFARHGDVTVDISGYAASAATLIGLGAKHTRISNTSFYLIHKVMSYVDAWGNMNEDEIAAVIADLEKIKDENEKMTLVAAKAYSEKSGKPVTDILALMKEEKWLTADEAKEWGFVDEVYNSTSRLDISAVSTKLNMMGMPVLPGKSEDNERFIDKVVNRLVGAMSSFNTETPSGRANQTTKTPIEMNQFEKINALLNVPSLESADGKGVYLNEAQLTILNQTLADRDATITNLQQNKTDYDNAINKINALHPDFAGTEGFENKINAISEKLAAKPGVAAAGTKESNKDTDNDGVDWNKMNTLEHMKENPEDLV